MKLKDCKSKFYNKYKFKSKTYLNKGHDGSVWAVCDKKTCDLVVKEIEFDVRSRRQDFIKYFNNEVFYQSLGAKMGISPKILDSRICLDGKTTKTMGIILMDKIVGIDMYTMCKECLDTGNLRLYIDTVNTVIDYWIELLKKKINHFDLHSGNIIVDDNNKPWIIDYGRIEEIETFDLNVLKADLEHILERLSFENKKIFHILRRENPS